MSDLTLIRRVADLEARTSYLEHMLTLLTIVIDFDALELAGCDCDSPKTWAEMEACGRDPVTGADVAVPS